MDNAVAVATGVVDDNDVVPVTAVIFIHLIAAVVVINDVVVFGTADFDASVVVVAAVLV